MLMTIIFVLFILLLWINLDFKLGRKKHIANLKRRTYPKRQTDWQLFGNGNELYESIFEDIRAAKDHIHVLFYIVRDDSISKKFLSLLEQKAQEGIEVRLLLDRIGSNIPTKNIKKLKASGVNFEYSNKPSFPYFFFSLNRRNHRKITVIDGHIGYFGGYNIGKEYLGKDPKLGDWRDYHLRIKGDGVQDLQKEFCMDWKEATKESLLEYTRYFPPLTKGSLPIRFVPSSGAYINDLLLKLIKEAKFEIIIASPYFIPGKEINDSLLAALDRGVSITILVPIKSDHMFVKEASFPYFNELLSKGGLIYQYTKGFYHGKLFLVDNKVCDFGTANFDQRSFYINDELNCIIKDDTFIKRVHDEVKNDIQHSNRLTRDRFEKRSIFTRGKEAFTTLIASFL